LKKLSGGLGFDFVAVLLFGALCVELAAEGQWRGAAGWLVAIVFYLSWRITGGKW